MISKLFQVIASIIVVITSNVNAALPLSGIAQINDYIIPGYWSTNYISPAIYFEAFTNIIELSQGGNLVVSIDGRGNVTYGKGVSPDAARKLFWESISKYVHPSDPVITNKTEILEVLAGIEHFVIPPNPIEYMTMTLEYRPPMTHIERLRAELKQAEDDEAARAKFKALLEKLRK